MKCWREAGTQRAPRIGGGCLHASLLRTCPSHRSCSVQCAENAKFLVRASYLEIYNEDIRDLLGADTKQKLEVRRSWCA